MSAAASIGLALGMIWFERRRAEPDGSAGVDALPADARAALDGLWSRHGIAFEIQGAKSGDGGNVHFEAAYPEDVATVARWLFEEWSKYPDCWFAVARVEKVVFCRSLRLEGEFVGGFVDSGALFLDVATQDEAHCRRRIHHEFFHVFDGHDDGSLGEDAAWTALNPPGFRYGDGGLTRVSDAAAGTLDSASTGFFTGYATSALSEDKAELFAWAMRSPELVRPLAARDPFLAAKWDRLGAMLRAPCADAASPFPER
ncbi:MAG: hypothetical protein HZA52_13305 [Planctomycetes bacterium]|nr:hypothetical protein [Planctomycetota bacterium]